MAVATLKVALDVSVLLELGLGRHCQLAILHPGRRSVARMHAS